VRYWAIVFLDIVPSRRAMKPDLDESLLNQFHAPIVGSAKGEEATRAMPLSEVLVTRLLDTFPVLMWAATPDGVLWYLNQRCVEYAGRSLSDFQRLGWADLIHPEDREETLRTWSHAVKSGSSYHVKHRIRRTDGEYRWFLTRGEALRDCEDRAIQFFGLSVDIDESVKREAEIRRAEEELRRSQRYLAEAQKVSHTGSWAWSPVSNVILYWSEECYRILGYDPRQGLPSFASSFERIHPEDRPALAETIERAVRKKMDFQTEYRLVLPDGTRRNVRIHSHPVLNASGELIEYIGTVMDITEQKRAEEERREHVWFLESMDRINRAMQRSNDVELMTSGVVQEALEIFACDRASLIYPCDPDTPTFCTVMEHTSPDYDGVLTLGQARPKTPEGNEVQRRALEHPGAVINPFLPAARQQFGMTSMLAIAVRPKGDRPYLFVLHCSRSRFWTAGELRLFEETGRRLGDALTSVLAHRNVLASEKELRRSQHYLAEGQKLSHTGSWAWNPITNKVPYWSEESYRIYGFDPAQGIPPFESTWERVHPEDRDALRAAIERGVREKAGLDLEHRLVLPGGIVRNHHVLAHPVLHGSGELVEYLGTVVDVTEQKRAEEERKEHLWFLECMDRVNRAMQRTNEVEGMMSGVLEETLAIFDCDRAWLVYPCDPNSPTVRAVMEHTSRDYPGAFALGEDLPVDRQARELLRRVLDGPGAVTDMSVSPELRERFSIYSMFAIAVRPKGDRPYLFGLHQCSHARSWTAAERRLFEEIARRLEDALTSVLAHRNLLASQEELRSSEERFRTFVDNATDAFFLYDEECIVLDVNRQACEALGYTREELIGMHPAQFNEDMTHERTLRIKQRLREHGSMTFTTKRRRKDGSLFPVEERLQAFNRGGRALGIGLARDITDRRHREQRLLAQYRVTQTLSEAGSLEKAAPGILSAIGGALEWDLGALWQVDAEGGVLRCIATWSPAPAATANFAAATRAITFGPGTGLPGRVWSSGGPVCIRDVALDPELPRAKSAAKEGLHAAFAFPVMLKSGIVGIIELFSREVRDADRGLLQMMAAIGSQVAQFIERTRAKDALRDAREKVAQASKIASLAELSASIAHEINQPLQAIVANGHASLRWLDATPPNIEKAIRTAKCVVRDGNAAADVVGRIRALFKHAAPAMVDLDINKLILQVSSLMADEMQGSGVSLETELLEDVPKIRADAVQIQQVIVNLMRNAIEAMAATMERPKRLWIRSRREGDNVAVDVQDRGIGFADAEKIFEPFVTTKETGMGMGLAICRSIVEAHAGRIWAARNPERGVTFSFSLPSENSVTG
jgi:PAS domain S-box-containing protein